MASGPFFEDQNNPGIMIQVGTDGGSIGSVEISDMLFTTRGPTAGLITMQWNVIAYQQGSTGLWGM
jgi:glucan 1,3-beta-glucosidase